MLYVVQVSMWEYTHVCMHVMYEGIRGQLWVSFLRHLCFLTGSHTGQNLLTRRMWLASDP